jgi:ABC-type sugar transport system ATPase subunit
MGILQTRDLTKHFGGLAALTDFDMTIGPGEIVGLIGPNGAGKTTVFNLVTGMLRPTAGRIVFDGREISHVAPHAICRLGIARTYQNVRPFAELTAMENILVAIANRRREPRPLNAAREEAERWLGFVGLSPYAGIARKIQERINNRLASASVKSRSSYCSMSRLTVALHVAANSSSGVNRRVARSMLCAGLPGSKRGVSAEGLTESWARGPQEMSV